MSSNGILILVAIFIIGMFGAFTIGELAKANQIEACMVQPNHEFINGNCKIVKGN